MGLSIQVELPITELCLFGKAARSLMISATCHIHTKDEFTYGWGGGHTKYLDVSTDVLGTSFASSAHHVHLCYLAIST